MELIYKVIMVIMDVVVIAYPGECAAWMTADRPFSPTTELTLLRQMDEECFCYYRAAEIPDEIREQYPFISI